MIKPGDTLARIFQIDQYRRRGESREHCHCGAARARQDFFSKELAQSGSCHRRILRLEDVRNCFPETARKCGEQWDCIYSSDLLAGLPQVAAKQVVKKAASCLKPGGYLLFANATFKSGEPACSECARRGLNYRAELEMADLTRGVPDGIISGQIVFRDPYGLNVYLELHRTPMPALESIIRSAV